MFLLFNNTSKKGVLGAQGIKYRKYIPTLVLDVQTLGNAVRENSGGFHDNTT